MEERRARWTTCVAAEEAFIASTVREVQPIAAIDDVELPAAPGARDARTRARRFSAARRAGAGREPASA